MRNEVLRNGDELSLPVPAGTKSGDLVVVGQYIGIAATDRQEAINPAQPYTANTSNPVGHATVWLRGVYEVPCSDAVASIGTALYVATGDGVKATVTTTATGGVKAGSSAAVIKNGLPTGGTKAAGTGTIQINLGF